MATTKQLEAVKDVTYRNNSPWCVLKLKTFEKLVLFIYNDMLFYIVKVGKIALIF